MPIKKPHPEDAACEFHLQRAVFLPAVFKYIITLAVICNDQREILDVELLDRLTSEILKSDDLAGFNAVAGKSARAAYRAQIDRFVAHYRINDLLRSFAFSYHSAKAKVKQSRCKSVHTT